jgi:probable F420-dependent oxidoreductase
MELVSGVMEIGKIGLFVFMDAMSASESGAFARKAERLGYRTMWFPEAWGREPFAHAAYLMARTDTINLATGIANIWARDPMTMAAAAKTVAEIGEDRFILGVGVRHKSLVADLRGHDYAKPYSYMREYLAKMKSSPYAAVSPKSEPPWVIAALRPKMLRLAATEARGTQTYLVTPEHTAQARAAMGPEAWLCVGQTVIFETDPVKARAVAREHLKFYLSQPNYIRNLNSLGFSDTDIGGCSDRLVDAVIAWGSEQRIRAYIDAHFQAGATHVCIMPLRTDGKLGPNERTVEAFAPG